MIKLIGKGRWTGTEFLMKEFTLSDVDYFEEYHESGSYGNKIKAVLKDKTHWDIEIKENKKLRNKIMSQVKKKGKIRTYGENMDTYCRTYKTKILKASSVRL